MAKYVLVAFEDDKEAEDFVRAIDAGYRNLFYTTPHPTVKGHYSVVAPQLGVITRGVFKKPTQYCECDPQSDKSVRGAKWGWWVCTKCAKPKQKHWQSPRNLLDKEGMKSREANLVLTIVEPSTPVI